MDPTYECEKRRSLTYNDHEHNVEGANKQHDANDIDHGINIEDFNMVGSPQSHNCSLTIKQLPSLIGYYRILFEHMGHSFSVRMEHNLDKKHLPTTFAAPDSVMCLPFKVCGVVQDSGVDDSHASLYTLKERLEAMTLERDEIVGRWSP